MSSQTASWLDRVDPIVVRQMRRLVRSHTFTWTTILCLAMMTVSICVCLLMVRSRGSTGPFDVLWRTASLGIAQIFAFFASFAPAVMFASAQTNDEMLDLSLSPKRVLRGYVLLGVLFSSYYLILSLPFISLSFMFGGPLLLMLLGALSAVLTGIASNLVFLSFLAKMRGFAPIVVMTVLLFFFYQLPFMAIGAVDVLISMRTIFAGFVSAPPGAPPPMIASPAMAAHPVFIGYSVFMWSVFGLLAYLLCRGHLAHPRRAAWKEIGVNLLVYGVFTVATSGVWAALRFSGIV